MTEEFPPSDLQMSVKRDRIFLEASMILVHPNFANFTKQDPNHRLPTLLLPNFHRVAQEEVSSWTTQLRIIPRLQGSEAIHHDDIN